MKKQNKIHIIDVTNRDGVQTSRLGLAKLQKTMINMYLNEMGVSQSEFGFPVTRHETNYLNANLELAKMGVLKPIILSGWIRAIKEDVDKACKLTKEDVIKMMVDAVHAARKLGIKIVGVNAEDASRTHIDYLIKFSRAAKKAGADRIRYCDTLGYDDPFTIYER